MGNTCPNSKLKTLGQHPRMATIVFTVDCKQVFGQLVTNKPKPSSKHNKKSLFCSKLSL